jgi:hypothetical protein
VTSFISETYRRFGAAHVLAYSSILKLGTVCLYETCGLCPMHTNFKPPTLVKKCNNVKGCVVLLVWSEWADVSYSRWLAAMMFTCKVPTAPAIIDLLHWYRSVPAPLWGTESVFCILIIATTLFTTNKQTPWPESASELCRPSDRPFSAKLVPTFADRVPRGQRDGSLRPYSRFPRPEPLLFYQVAPRCTHEAEWAPFQTHYFSENLVEAGIETGTSGS